MTKQCSLLSEAEEAFRGDLVLLANSGLRVLKAALGTMTFSEEGGVGVPQKTKPAKQDFGLAGGHPLLSTWGVS
jgi:hypothetical protein